MLNLDNIELAVTRFNTQTWQENIMWKRLNKFDGAIYGTPNSINNKIDLYKLLFVIEMDNTNNKILGIGLIKNKSISKYHDIYSWKHYNRYCYKSHYRIDYYDFNPSELKLIYCLEELLFKGKDHLKRGTGISLISKKIKNNKNNFKLFILTMFIKKFNLN